MGDYVTDGEVPTRRRQAVGLGLAAGLTAGIIGTLALVAGGGSEEPERTDLRPATELVDETTTTQAVTTTAEPVTSTTGAPTSTTSTPATTTTAAPQPSTVEERLDNHEQRLDQLEATTTTTYVTPTTTPAPICDPCGGGSH